VFLRRRAVSRIMPRDYVKDPAEIYRQSFATIEAEARLDALAESLRAVARRMIHACGMTDLVDDLAWHGDPVAAARRAIAGGAPILTDAQMVASGIIRGRFPQTEIVCVIADEAVADAARRLGTTRSAASVELWRGRMQGAVVAIGNAPTALLEVVRMVLDENLKPALVIGMPVGFVSAAESKALLSEIGTIPWIVVDGRKGGSTLVVAAIHAMLALAEARQAV